MPGPTSMKINPCYACRYNNSMGLLYLADFVISSLLQTMSVVYTGNINWPCQQGVNLMCPG